MRKKIILLFSCIIFIMALCWYDGKVKKAESTNLNNILIDNIVLGDNLKKVDLTKYTKNIYDGYTYTFDEIAINVNNGIIDSLSGNLYENKVIISINENTNLDKIKNIEDIENILGNNFKDKWYDREQGLKTHVYHDANNNIKADFIYNNYNNNLVWVKLKKTI